jgi:hypothetical protein
VSNTKVLNNLRDNALRDLKRSEERVSQLVIERDRHQRNADKTLAMLAERRSQLDCIEDIMKRRHTAAAEAAGEHPDSREHAARAREARAALESVLSVLGKPMPRPRRSTPGPEGEPIDLPASASHGTVNAYNNLGCRCGPCKAASKRSQRDQRGKRMNARVIRDNTWYHPAAPHGTYNGYTNYGCRCTPCRSAGRRHNTAKSGGAS